MRCKTDVSDRNGFDVSQIVEEQQPNRFLAGLVVLSWLVTFLDGLDANLITFASPHLAKNFHLSAMQLGNVFSAGVLGTMAGGFLFGYVGDRFGRRMAIVIATLSFGVCTVLFSLARGYQSLLILRVLNGIPLGGALPLTWVLNAELTPKKYRATMITTVMLGYSLGTAAGGPTALLLIPRLGWEGLFKVSGLCSIAVACILFVALPESVRFLVVKGCDASRILRVIKRIRPGTLIPAGSVFIAKDEDADRGGFRPNWLFEGHLRIVTTLIWTAYIASSLIVYLIVNWTPIMLENLHFSRTEAAGAASLISVTGCLFGLLLMRFIDRLGPGAITVMPVGGAVLLVLAGFLNTSRTGFLIADIVLGGFLIGGHTGLHSICGIYYPSSWRSNGAGWATSIAKIGSFAGPILGGALLANGIPIQKSYMLFAIFPATFAVSIYMLGLNSGSRVSRAESISPKHLLVLRATGAGAE